MGPAHSQDVRDRSARLSPLPRRDAGGRLHHRGPRHPPHPRPPWRLGSPRDPGPRSASRSRRGSRFTLIPPDCRGIKEVLRPVNIPVDVVIIGGHWTPHFINEHKYLSHGDDPYALAPEIPIGELPIDQATYDAWFVNNPNPLHNVGRRVMELTIQYLPKQLLWEYCLDGVQSNDHASGRVYNNNFAPGYTVAELEAMQLWEKLAAKVAALGGCGNIL